MAKYIANRIIAGAMDYVTVVTKFPQYKEDIDSILIENGREDLIKDLGGK